MDGNDQRNLILAMALGLAILLGWDFFVLGPARESARIAQEAAAAAREAQASEAATAEAEGLPAPGAESYATRDEALTNNGGERIAIQSDYLEGSFSLQGARFDDLKLLKHRQTIDEDSPPVEWLNPLGGPLAFYAGVNWAAIDASNERGGAGFTSPWRRLGDGPLTPETPVRLRIEDGPIAIDREIALDERYLVTITDTVTNTSGYALNARPTAETVREGLPKDVLQMWLSHEGAIAVHEGTLSLSTYRGWAKDAASVVDQRDNEIRREVDPAARQQLLRERNAPATTLDEEATGGWIALADQYWMTALIPPQDHRVEQQLIYDESTGYRARWRSAEPYQLAPGESVTHTSHLFLGAKNKAILDDYKEQLNLPRFEDAIDWGWFWFLTKPLFWLVHMFYGWVGNFGVAILMLTIVVKAVFFPLANRAFVSMSKMKKLQPKLQELKEVHKDDQQAFQMAMIKLYRDEKVNPVAGCLPILAQMPVFFALYKTLFVTLDMRHAPFFGWIQDLSAPDPTSMWNLFGLLPFDPASVPLIGGVIGGIGLLAIGVWPLLMGITMWMQTSLNPPPTDPTQAMIFKLMPFIFTIFLANFAAGLVLYWTWSNTLTIMQQYAIMKRHGVETGFDDAPQKLRNFIARFQKTKEG